MSTTMRTVLLSMSLAMGLLLGPAAATASAQGQPGQGYYLYAPSRGYYYVTVTPVPAPATSPVATVGRPAPYQAPGYYYNAGSASYYYYTPPAPSYRQATTAPAAPTYSYSWFDSDGTERDVRRSNWSYDYSLAQAHNL